MFLMKTIQRDSAIMFPMLGDLTINPPSYFTVFGFDIYFYGLLIGCGFLLGTLYCAKKAPEFGIKTDDVYDFLLWLIPSSILGARLYYVVFRLDYFLANPSQIFNLRQGGLAIYGGIILGALAGYIVSRRKKIPVTAFLDLIIFGLLIGQIIGRWGNFMNREAFGAETEVFCRMGLLAPDGSSIFVHPTFLYESLWNLGVLIFLIVFNKLGKRRYDGQNMLIYFFGYGVGRFWIEGLRTDSLYIGSSNIRASQALSLALVVVSLVILIIQSRKTHGPTYAQRKKLEAEQAEAPELTEET